MAGMISISSPSLTETAVHDERILFAEGVRHVLGGQLLERTPEPAEDVFEVLTANVGERDRFVGQVDGTSCVQDPCGIAEPGVGVRMH